jgi:hypothetical protein
MRRFFHDRRGSAIIWTLFLILILFTLSFVVYSGVTVYAKYQTCETDLQCAAIITVDAGLLNANMRDVQLDVPASAAQLLLEENLTEAGWMQEDENWTKRDNGKLIYALEDMQIAAEGKTLRIEATFVMPYPWMVGGIGEIRIPMTVLSSVMYIE